MATVATTPINPAIITFLRYVLTSAGAVWVNKGLLDESTLDVLVGAIVTAVPIVWGVILSYKNAETIKKAEPFVPDAIISK